MKLCPQKAYSYQISDFFTVCFFCFVFNNSKDCGTYNASLASYEGKRCVWVCVCVGACVCVWLFRLPFVW